MIKFPRVIVITGTPGVGKTTISKALAERLEGYHISLSELVKQEKLVLALDSERDTLVTDMNKLSQKVSDIVGCASLDVVVEGHYASDVISSEVASHVFVLRIDPETLRDRLQARGYEEGKVIENITAELLDVCLVNALANYGSEGIDEIDVTNMTVQAVVDEVMKVLHGRRKPRIGEIDWLRKLDEEGRLDNFLALINKL